MAEMLESYTLSCVKKGDEKDYKLKFKVAKGVKVSFNQVGDINEIHLNYDSDSKGNDYNKNYKVTGPLKVQFFQNHAVGAGKDAPPPPTPPDPDIEVGP